jgi:hypothetical protein
VKSVINIPLVVFLFALFLSGRLPINTENGTPLFAFCNAQGIIEKLEAELPIRAAVCYDTVAGGLPYTAEDEAIIRRVADALSGITVYEARGGGHTDDYLYYYIEWADGTAFGVIFQAGMLLNDRDELYAVTGLEALIMALPPILD